MARNNSLIDIQPIHKAKKLSKNNTDRVTTPMKINSIDKMLILTQSPHKKITEFHLQKSSRKSTLPVSPNFGTRKVESSWKLEEDQKKVNSKKKSPLKIGQVKIISK